MNILRLIRQLLLAALRGQYLTNIDVVLGVKTECRDSEGRLKWSDQADYPDPRPRLPMSLKLAGWLLLISTAAAFATFVNEWGLLLIPMARVTTAGLNAILNSTLCNSLTSASWFVFLCKQVASDGAITSGAATFTSASGTFVSGDIGRSIIVQGAGAAGADLFTTISAVGSTTSITLAANAGTTVSGARYAFECRLADTSASHTSFVESTTYSNSFRATWTPGAPAAGSVDNSGSVAAFTLNGTDWIFGAGLISEHTKGGSTGTLYGMGVNSSGVGRQVLSGDILNVTVTATVTAT